MKKYGKLFPLFSIVLLICCLCESKLTFKYVTDYNKDGRSMTIDDLQKDSVNVLKPIIFVINGLDSSNNMWVNALVDEYLEKQIHNVFLLDLESQKGNDELVSSELKDFIMRIYNKTGEQYLHWRLIGITGSGFEIAMDVGRRMTNDTNKKIDRITGLDPTHNSSHGKENHLNFFDDFANLVDVVHSNVRKFDKELKHFGHVDFYIDDINCKDKKESDSESDCGYLNAIKMFKRSVNAVNLTAVKCPTLEDFEYNKCTSNSRVLFGENMPSNADGIYLLKYE